jgi:predicted RNase H-like HicB family nuclease
MTQGITKEELIENLREMLRDINSSEIPYIRRVEEMAVPS